MVVLLLLSSKVLRPWRNWQTRRIKDPVRIYSGGGSNPLGRIVLLIGEGAVIQLGWIAALFLSKPNLIYGKLLIHLIH